MSWDRGEIHHSYFTGFLRTRQKSRMNEEVQFFMWWNLWRTLWNTMEREEIVWLDLIQLFLSPSIVVTVNNWWEFTATVRCWYCSCPDQHLVRDIRNSNALLRDYYFCSFLFCLSGMSCDLVMWFGHVTYWHFFHHEIKKNVSKRLKL